jgi:hypothetical protein
MKTALSLTDAGEILERVIIGYKQDRAARLCAAPPVCRRGKGDCGRMMPILKNLRIKPSRRSKNTDYRILQRWMAHFEELGIPYLVVRESEATVSLYKERRVADGPPDLSIRH